MSKIQADIIAATELKTKRGEDRQAFLARAIAAVTDLDDEGWEGLSEEAQDWFNEAADAANAKKKVLPDFPDLKDEASDGDEKPATRRRGAAAKEDGDEKPATAGTVAIDEPKVNQAIKLVTKRGKEISGTVVEIDDEVVVLKLGNGEEEEFARDRVASMFGLDTGGSDDDGPADPIKVGQKVTAVTKRGKEATGKLLEIDDEVVVIEVDGEEQEFARDRVTSVTPVGKAAAKEEATEKPATRRGAAAKEEADEKPAKAKRSTNEGVSVGQRIKEIILDDLEATVEEVGKVLTKEKIEFRDNTLKLNFTEAHKFLDLLKTRKMLKA